MNFVDPLIGQINQAGAADALFLKVFSGEVLTAFKLNTVADELQTVRTIASGKSAQFPVTGWLSAHYHQPGTQINGQQGVQNEKIITIDDLLISDYFIPNIEEAKAHFDIRSIYSGELGRAIARQYDNRIIRQHILSARSSANLSATSLAAPAAPVLSQSGGGSLANAALFFKVTYVTDAGETTPSTESTITPTLNNTVTVQSPAFVNGAIGYNVYAATVTNTEKLQNAGPIPLGQNWTLSATATTTGVVVPATNTSAGPTGSNAGNSVVAANSDTDAPTLRSAILDAFAALDKNNIPKEDRFVLLKPTQYWLLFKDVTFGFIGNQFFGGQGGIGSGQLPMIGGVPIRVSNNFPAAAVVNAVTGEQNAYNGDFTHTVAIVGHKAAVGTVKLMDLAVEMEKSVRYQGTLSVARMALGTGVLRPEASYEIKNG